MPPNQNPIPNNAEAQPDLSQQNVPPVVNSFKVTSNEDHSNQPQSQETTNNLPIELTNTSIQQQQEGNHVISQPMDSQVFADDNLQQTNISQQQNVLGLNTPAPVSNNYNETSNSLLQTPKSKHTGLRKRTIVIFSVIGFVFITLLIMGLSYLFISNREFSGKYNNREIVIQKIPTKDGAYSFELPVSMENITETDTTAEYVQKSNNKSEHITKDGWESRIEVRGSPKDGTGNQDLLNSLRGNDGTKFYGKETIHRLMGSVFEKQLKEEGQSNIVVNSRNDMSDYDKGRLALDFSYTEKDSGVEITGRRILIIAPNTSFNIDVRAVKKLWSDKALDWDDITNSFHVQEDN